MKRRKGVNFEANEHLIKLVQMGANVKQINSKMCYVKFDIEGFKLSYVYNINKKGKYFLERIRPYPLPLLETDNEKEVIDIIKIDLKQYKNAIASQKIDKFSSINLKMIDTIKKFEDLYLYYKVDLEKCDEILEKIEEINNDIIKIKNNSKRLFFEKEPNNL